MRGGRHGNGDHHRAGLRIANMQTIQTKDYGDGIILASIDLPDRSMNIITPNFRADLNELIDLAVADPAIKGMVLTSGKANSFIVGADLTELVEVYGRETLAQAFARSQELSGLFRRLESFGKPVAVAINAAALGGGMELCLACHYRVVSNAAKAILGQPEINVGLLPGAGATQRLPRLIGIANALPLMLSGESVGPDVALRMGIVNEIAAPDEIVARAVAWLQTQPLALQPWDVKGFKLPGGAGCLAPHAAESFQAGTSRIAAATQRNYPAPLAIASAVFEGTQVPIDLGLQIESKYFAKLILDPVARNLMRTMFINKGAAAKLTGRPAGIPKSQVRTLGVLGAGMMGAGIAHVASAADINTILLDATQEQAERGKAHSAKLLQKEVAKGRLTFEDSEARLARIIPTTDYALLATADLVVEAVFESREVKSAVWQKASAVLPEAVFATNTSTLPVTSLSEAVVNPERFIGLHFFSPVERMPLVEIIRGSATSDETLAKSLDFVAQLRKIPIVVNDSPGFFTSRVFGTYVDEGMAMLAEGVAPALIENAGRRAGMPVGPLAICDEVTIELQLKVHRQAVADRLAVQFQRLTAIGVVKKMVELQRIGRRANAGFYDYPADGKKQLWPGLGAIFPVAAGQPEVEELVSRFLYIQALEAARCVDEGVIANPAEADLGSILGIGYPSWTGGVLSFIDTMGVKEFTKRAGQLAQRYGTRFTPPADLLARAEADQPYYPAAA
jgi:3-hydroxyacyl-CoA dehydrogenase/enoyl-CoA hydratase/3-hydroxybutyryl-CoA epimerase